MVHVKKYEKSGFAKESFCTKISKVPNFPNKKHKKPTLHSLIANHVLKMSIKLKFHCLCFKNEALFCSGGFESVPTCLYQGLFTRCDLYRTILYYYYDEAKEMIHELVNLKGAVYEPKKKAFSLHSVTYQLK